MKIAPNVLSSTADVAGAASARVAGVGGWLNGLAPAAIGLIVPIVGLAVGWAGVKMMITGKNPLKNEK